MNKKHLLLGLAIGLCSPFLGGFIVVKLGWMPVATASKPLPLEAYLAHSALRAALTHERSVTSPIPVNETNLAAGAKVYKTDCAVCHGLPKNSMTAIAKGMFPDPPQLFDAMDMVTDDPVGSTFWKVKNGIRLTGMPGFHGSRTDNELWQVTLLISNADKLPESVSTLLKAAP